jgi:hypothetical protein
MAGTHEFTVTSTDNLGNPGARTVTFEIIVTDASLQQEIARFVAGGAIRNNGLVKALLAQLSAAAAARSRGNCIAAAGAYRSFINLLQGQFMKGVDPNAARILIADAQYLLSHCP